MKPYIRSKYGFNDDIINRLEARAARHEEIQARVDLEEYGELKHGAREFVTGYLTTDWNIARAGRDLAMIHFPSMFDEEDSVMSRQIFEKDASGQWAGRQLMVGFTLPLMAVGTAATKTFMDMEAQALRFRKVYGDLFTPQSETKEALANITELGKQFTKYDSYFF